MDSYPSNKFFESIPSKSSFMIGFFGGLGISFTVGFFILIGVMAKGNASASVQANNVNDNPVVVNQPTPLPQAANQPQQPPSISLAVSDKDWVKGDRKAKISIIEFSDTECPFCKRVHPTLQKLTDDYKGQVNWVYRHFPLTSLHSKAAKEAEATECAGELGGNTAFGKYLDRLFEVTPSNNGLDASELPKIASYVGINQSKFEECLNSGRYAQKVNDQAQQAQGAGGNGTPYSVIVSGDQNIPVSGAVPYEQFKSVIDSLL